MERGQYESLETYPVVQRKNSQRGTAAFVLAEASREPWASGHVEHVKPPILLHGVMPIELLPQVAAVQKTARKRNGWPLQKNAQVLAAGVSSWPEPIETEDTKRADLWERLKVAEIKKRWGDLVGSIVKHIDEGHRHIHWFIICPIRDRMLAMGLIHPGVKARDEALDAGLGKKRSNAAYKSAMRTYQDENWVDVGSRVGLARATVRRVRLTTTERKAKLNAERLLTEAHQALERTEEGSLALALARTRMALKEAEERAQRAELDMQMSRGKAKRAEEEVARLNAMYSPAPAQRARSRDTSAFRSFE